LARAHGSSRRAVRPLPAGLECARRQWVFAFNCSGSSSPGRGEWRAIAPASCNGCARLAAVPHNLHVEQGQRTERTADQIEAWPAPILKAVAFDIMAQRADDVAPTGLSPSLSTPSGRVAPLLTSPFETPISSRLPPPGPRPCHWPWGLQK
jgi:hypothetical protein